MLKVKTDIHAITSISFLNYCGGFAQSIARQQASKHVLTHAPCNNTVEVFFRVRAWTVAIQCMRHDITQQCVGIM
jgi:hypothetical protein